MKNIDLINKLKEIFKDDITFVCQNLITINYNYTILYLKGSTDTDTIIQTITQPLSVNSNLSYTEKNDFQDLESTIVDLNKGQVILIDNYTDKISIINCQQVHLRSINEPDNEITINGGKDGFIESMITNIALVRQKLPNENLRFKHIVIGDGIKTSVILSYLDNHCDIQLLNEVENRINKIKLEGIYDAHYIVEIIKDNKRSFFNTVGETERPDSFCAKLLEGGVGVIINGSPTALLAPYIFIENFKSNDDYYSNFYYASFTRSLRYLAFCITISAPALYIAIVGFHHEIIPSFLAINIAAATSAVPLGVIIECTLFIILFELLREAVLRMPSKVGQALSIVGAIIIGQAAVEAKIVSAPIIIVVAITAVTGFMTPKMNTLIVFLRLFAFIAAAMFGLYGIIAIFIVFLTKLFSIKSFNSEYSHNFFGLSSNRLKDSLFRAPFDKFNKNRRK